MPYRLGLFVLRQDANRHADLIATMRAILEQLAGVPSQTPEPPVGPMPHGHVETALTAGGLIVTPFGTPPRGVSDAIRESWPEILWTDAARVAYLEADQWNPHAERNTLAQAGGRCGVRIGTIRGVPIVSEDSVGLFQINVCAWPYSREQMLDPRQNAAAGYRVYREQGWAAWHFTSTTLGLV